MQDKVETTDEVEVLPQPKKAQKKGGKRKIFLLILLVLLLAGVYFGKPYYESKKARELVPVATAKEVLTESNGPAPLSPLHGNTEKEKKVQLKKESSEVSKNISMIEEITTNLDTLTEGVLSLGIGMNELTSASNGMAIEQKKVGSKLEETLLLITVELGSLNKRLDTIVDTQKFILTEMKQSKKLSQMERLELPLQVLSPLNYWGGVMYVNAAFNHSPDIRFKLKSGQSFGEWRVSDMNKTRVLFEHSSGVEQEVRL